MKWVLIWYLWQKKKKKTSKQTHEVEEKMMVIRTNSGRIINQPFRHGYYVMK